MTPAISRRTALASLLASGAGFSPALTRADNWPSKPLRLVVPFAPGGSSEIVARAVAGEMAKTIGQNVFVENRPGGAGNIAMQEVANASDEHTLILGHIGTLAVNPYIFPKLPYDPLKDLAPIALIGSAPLVWVVAKPPHGVLTAAQFVEQAVRESLPAKLRKAPLRVDLGLSPVELPADFAPDFDRQFAETFGDEVDRQNDAPGRRKFAAEAIARTIRHVGDDAEQIGFEFDFHILLQLPVDVHAAIKAAGIGGAQQGCGVLAGLGELLFIGPAGGPGADAKPADDNVVDAEVKEVKKG